MQRRALFALSLLAAAGTAFAQGYPNKPIKLQVPFAPGGTTDIIARVISEPLGKALGQPVVVENKAGGGGVVGANETAKSAPDGYTLGMATVSTTAANPAINPKIPYNAEADFTPIAYVASSPQVILVPLSSPARTLKEFIDYARQNPGRLNYASSGNGTISNLSTEIFKAQSGTFLVHIPYRGTGLSIADLVSGKVDVLFDSVVSGMPHVRDGKLRALAVTSPKRSALVPELPPWPSCCPASSRSPGLASTARAACRRRSSTVSTRP